MNYIKALVPRVANLKSPWSRSFNPTTDQKFVTTIPLFDISDTNEDLRLEFWESSTGDITQEQLNQYLYKYDEKISSSTEIVTTSDQTIEFLGLAADKLILTLDNQNTIQRSVQLLRSSDDFRVELIRVPVNKLFTIEIPRPFEHYKLAVPENFTIKFYPYKLV